MTSSSTSTATNTSDTPTGSERRPRGCGPRGHLAARFGGGWGQPPVNIEETDQAYLLSLYAAGLNKSGIRVSAQGDMLSIRYDAAPTEDGTRKFTRRELPQRGFAREFALNAKVQIDAITATYSEGVLTVHLPKTPAAMQPEHQVPVR